MRFLLALCLLVPQQDEVDKSKEMLTKGLTTLERYVVDRALAQLVKLNDEKTPDLLIAAFRAGVPQIAELQKERQTLLKAMEKVEAVRDQDGKITKGDLNKWTFLKRDHDVLAAKIEILNYLVPRTVDQIPKLTTTKTIIVALNNTTEWFPRACCAEALGKIGSPEAVTALIA